MGLFKSKEVKQVNDKMAHVMEYDNVWFNLSEKALKVTLVSDEPYLKDVYVVIDKETGLMRLTHGGILIAEFNKRNKAFGQLESKAGIRALEMSMQKETGDYGDYYHCRLKFAGGSSFISTIG